MEDEIQAEPVDEWDRQQERLDRIEKVDRFSTEVARENAAFAKLPPWRQAELEGDYLVEDSGMTIGDNIREQ